MKIFETLKLGKKVYLKAIDAFRYLKYNIFLQEMLTLSRVHVHQLDNQWDENWQASGRAYQQLIKHYYILTPRLFAKQCLILQTYLS